MEGEKTANTDKTLIDKPWLFQKGDDPRRNLKGNPGSRQYCKLFEEAIKKIATDDPTLTDAERDLAIIGIKEALKGSYHFYKDVMDRLYGKATEKHEHSGPNGGAIELKTVRDDFKSRIAGIIARSGTGSDNQ